MKNDGMDEMNIREYLENHKLLTDGAMGTYFDTVEKENYICSEEANITNPSLVRQIHKNYVKNGAQLLRSNTFLANRETLLSSLRLLHTCSVKASISFGILTSFGSPSKLGSGLPSCI